jgi:Zn-dependent protease
MPPSTDKIDSSKPGALIELDQTPVIATIGTAPGFIALAAGSYIAARIQRPRWPRLFQWLLAAGWFGLYQIADTLHTVGHIRSARQFGAPVDRILLAWGFQATHYDNNAVTPRQHMARAAGGVLTSGAVTVASYPFYAIFSRIPILGALIEAWFMCNALIFVGASTPTPHFDAASILKWFVAQRTGEEALGDEAVQTAGSAVILGLSGLTLILALRGRWRLAFAALVAAGIFALDLYVLKGGMPL